ncbi:MAG: GntR family transcriptional regulator, partial [Vibrio fluvialis]
MKNNLCTTYSAQVIAHIKESLLSGVLRPGDPIREAALAEKLGISRGPVREAVQALALEGLVSNLPQKAKYIRRMSAKEIEDSYCMGGTLEGACVARALPFMDEVAMRDLRESFRQIEEQCHEASGLSALSDADDAFHNALMARCDNKLMVDTARKSCWHISKFLYYKIWDKIFTP